MVKRVADVGFEEDYARYVERKEKVREEILARAEEEIAEKTAKLDQLIELTSHEEEFDDEPVDEDLENETDEEPVEGE